MIIIIKSKSIAGVIVHLEVDAESAEAISLYDKASTGAKRCIKIGETESADGMFAVADEERPLARLAASELSKKLARLPSRAHKSAMISFILKTMK